jgi:hypothetical protein
MEFDSEFHSEKYAAIYPVWAKQIVSKAYSYDLVHSSNSLPKDELKESLLNYCFVIDGGYFLNSRNIQHLHAASCDARQSTYYSCDTNELTWHHRPIEGKLWTNHAHTNIFWKLDNKKDQICFETWILSRVPFPQAGICRDRDGTGKVSHQPRISPFGSCWKVKSAGRHKLFDGFMYRNSVVHLTKSDGGVGCDDVCGSRKVAGNWREDVACCKTVFKYPGVWASRVSSNSANKAKLRI